MKSQYLQAHRKSTGAGILVGVGVVAAIDEIIFHQLLAWHHFYDISTPMVGLVSDAILHAAELIFLTAGFMALLNLQRKGQLIVTSAVAGLFCGGGAFQLFDGVVNHKLLRIHQIRYGVNIVPYDIIWNAIAILFLAIGIWMLYRCNKNKNNKF